MLEAALVHYLRQGHFHKNDKHFRNDQRFMYKFYVVETHSLIPMNTRKMASSANQEVFSQPGAEAFGW